MDTQISRKPLFYEAAANWLVQQAADNKLPLLASVIIGLLSYTFAFTNKLVNHDETYNLFGKGATLDSGRWGLGLLDSIFPNYSMPWIYGILTIILMAIAVAFIVRIFSIQSKPLQVLLAGCVIAFPSLTGTFAFMYTSSSYALGFLLAVVAAFLVQQKGMVYWIFAVGCMVFSVAIYQSYIAVSASLLVLILIHRLLLEEEVGTVIRSGFLYVGILIVSLGLYYTAMKLSLVLKGIVLNSYANERVAFSLTSLPASIVLAYQNFIRVFTDFHHSLIPTDFSRKLHFFSLIATGVLLVLWGIGLKKKSLSRILLLTVLIGILPLAISCMYVFTGEIGVHTLVLYGFTAVYFLMILVADVCRQRYFSAKVSEAARRVLINAVAICLALIVIINIYIANISFLSLHLQYETLYSFYTTLVSDIRMMPEFDEDTKLAVIGTWKYPEHYEKQFEFTYRLYGMFDAAPGLYSGDRFMQYYLGIEIPVATPGEKRSIQESEEFQNMRVYPYYGSMQMFGDVLVVKLS